MTQESKVCPQCGRPEFGKITCRRAWQPTLVFLPGESHGHRSLEGYSPWDSKKSSTTEQAYMWSYFCFLAGVQHWDPRLEEEAEAGKKLQEASPALKHLQEGWGRPCHVQNLCWCCTYSQMFETLSRTNCGPQPQLGLQDALFFSSFFKKKYLFLNGG